MLDYASRWSIEPLFSDFKSRGFGLEPTPIESPKRLDSLILIMALALYWYVSTGFDDALNNATAIEKKAIEPTDTHHGSVRQVYRSALSWFQRGWRLLIRYAHNSKSWPEFIVPLKI